MTFSVLEQPHTRLLCSVSQSRFGTRRWAVTSGKGPSKVWVVLPSMAVHTTLWPVTTQVP